MTAIKHALYVNTSLKSFNMSSSGLGTDGKYFKLQFFHTIKD